MAYTELTLWQNEQQPTWCKIQLTAKIGLCASHYHHQIFMLIVYVDSGS